MILTGGCRCGLLEYGVKTQLAPVFHCHCGFCRHVHGASFVTIGFISARSFVWLSSSDRPSVYVTPAGHHRHFCRQCASPIYNLAPGIGLACILVMSLSEPAKAKPWAHVNTESKAPWFEIQDSLPQFKAWPTQEELSMLARDNAATLPNELVIPDA